ncbi:MAG: cysteine peptidase family C39 domain-containing protein, partial [Aquisalimonadaceae bacterium]
VAVTVAVELLIALALAVTAVGAASAALNLARRIGGLSSNALQLLGRIYILLERMTRRLAAERPPAATNPAGHASADARRPQARADQHQQADQEGLEGARQSQNVATNKNVGGAGGNWNVIDEVADSSVIQQVNDLSCGQACVGMILGDREINASQEVIAKLAGDGPTYEAQLASVLNKLDSSNSRQWIGAGVDAEDVGTFHGLSSTGSWGAQLLEKGNKIGHWVVVDGLDDAGRVIVRDPWQATKYRMDLTEFQNTWTGYSVWGQ